MQVFIQWMHWRMNAAPRPICTESLHTLNDLDLSSIRRQLTFSYTDPWRTRVMRACPELWRLGCSTSLRRLVEAEVGQQDRYEIKDESTRGG